MLDRLGKHNYILETIAPEALKEVERGSLALDGVTVLNIG